MDTKKSVIMTYESTLYTSTLYSLKLNTTILFPCLHTLDPYTFEININLVLNYHSLMIFEL